MNEKVLVAVVIIIVGVIIATIAFLIFPSKSPPVDVSGIDLPPFMNSTDLMPKELRGIELGPDDLYSLFATVPHLYRPGEYLVEHTTGIFDSTVVHIMRTWDEAYDGETLDIFYFNLSSRSDSGVKARTSNWFLCDFEGTYAFFWGSDNWIFGVVAPSSYEGEGMADSFVQHLRRLSGFVPA